MLRQVAIALAPALAAGAAAAQPVSVEDLSRIAHVTGQAVSPDGARIAYTVADRPDVAAGEPDGELRTDLYIAREGQRRAFITDDAELSDVAWRPDGGAVTFVSKRDGDAHDALYEIPVDGGAERRILAVGADIEDYAWAPDGRALYVVAGEPDDGVEDALEEKGFKAWVYEEDFEFSRLWRVDMTAADPVPQRIDLEGDVSSLALSPDGGRIAVAVAPTPLIDDYYMKRRIHVLDAASGEVDSVVETPGKLGGFAFSPSGETIAFHAGIDVNDPSDGVLMIADAATGAYRAVEPEAERHVMDVDWLSGDEILVLVHAGVGSRLAVYSVEGEHLRDLAEPESVVVRDVDLGASRDRIGLVADAPTHPRALFAGDSGGGFALWGSHNAWLAERDLGEQSVFEYQARDGLRVEGMLITPDGERPDGGWPLILMVHGGPEAHRSNGWHTRYSEPGQVAAGQGYAAFWPNYRGSTGRGVAFTKRHQGDYAGGEFNDLVDGVDALAEAGIVDPDRVGITGGSYGGYASAWGATALSEHFAASVMFVGISDQVSKFGTTDIPWEMYHVHSRQWPWEDWLGMLEVSPIYHAGQSQTPLLILHGEDDTRVHPSQSLEMFRYMKLRSQAPVRLVFYPGEGHGNDRAAARYDYALRLMRWMDHYLKGPGGEPPAFDLGLAEQLGIDPQ